MLNFTKAFWVIIIGITSLFLIFSVGGVVIHVLLYGNDYSFLGINLSWITGFLVWALIYVLINLSLFLFIALPYYWLISKFMRFGSTACLILGLLFGIIGYLQAFFTDSWSTSGANLGVWLMLGTMFGIMLGICHRIFVRYNQPVSYPRYNYWQRFMQFVDRIT